MTATPQHQPQLSLEHRLAWCRRHWESLRAKRAELITSVDMQRIHKEVFGETIDLQKLVKLRAQILVGEPDGPQPFNPAMSPEQKEALQSAIATHEDETAEEAEHEPPPERLAPGHGFRRAIDTRTRRRFAKDLLRKDPTLRIKDVQRALIAEFGYGLANNLFSEIRAELGIGTGRRGRPTIAQEMPPPQKPQREKIARTNHAIRHAAADSDVREAIQELLDRVPQILELRIWHENGEPHFECSLEQITRVGGRF